MKIKTILLFATIALFSISCGWKASDQDIKLMEETRSSALKAEDESSKKKRELEQVKKELEKEMNEKNKAEAELKKVQEELAKFEEENKAVIPDKKKKKN